MAAPALVYVTDTSLSIRRTGSPSRFRYVDARGRPVRAPKQRMLEFGKALPRLRRALERDLARPGLSREKVLATVVHLLELTHARVGNEEYARKNKSFGLTTLRNKHVAVEGSSIEFRYRGKSGKEHTLSVVDRRIARIVRRCEELPGQLLFEYVDENGDVQAVESSDVNDYIRRASGGDFTAKDYRTLAGRSSRLASDLHVEERAVFRLIAKKVLPAATVTLAEVA